MEPHVTGNLHLASTESSAPDSSKPAETDQTDTPAAVLEPPPEPAPPEEPGALQLWLHRISVFLFVLVSAIAGVLLLILPWTPNWTDNYLLLSYPGLRTIVANGFFRGFCSGLGLLDIWIGFWEALHYHE
jgi:hypothetical protein